MGTLTLQLPDSLEKELGEITNFLAAKLYEAGKITLGQAGETAGINKWDFAELLCNYGVNYLDPSALADLEALRRQAGE